jgi:serine/threonine-protein kinase
MSTDPPATQTSAPIPGTIGRSTTQGRFVAGTILAGRYRVVTLLGRGGMGEVYKADDLTLDQPVALNSSPRR